MAVIALAELRQLTVEWFDDELVGRRAWSMRDHLTTYDACYVALAQFLEAPLVTCDRKLARSSAAAPLTILTPPG